MSDSIIELREWRDHDVHMVSEAIQEVYSRNPTDKDLYQLWNRINELHNTTKEALFSLIGFIVSGNRYSPNYVLRILGEGEQQKNKYYDPTNPDEKKAFTELQNFTIKRNLGENAQRVMDILMDLWSIKITSKICPLQTFSQYSFPKIKNKFQTPKLT